ncbi:MAG: PHP domain-containing protein [Chloroflexi bacterium]|nr:PHP domain-containing protein [Chloroflexota bacterium]
MWRKCDLHRHTTPDDATDYKFDPATFVAECVRDGLEVVAVTDHDVIDHVDAIIEAAKDSGITVVPGVELSTDRGHILALAPGEEGRTVLEELKNRVPSKDSGTLDFDRLTNTLAEPRGHEKTAFRNHVILVGAHADRDGSILAPKQPGSTGDQISYVEKLHALEVANDENISNWRHGIKQTRVKMAMLRNSDAHPNDSRGARSTWIYLPEVNAQCLRHALATYESSISHDACHPSDPEFWIKSILFEEGPYNGRKIEFSPRTNALIGPPSSGKSLVIDAIRHVFDIPCPIDDVQSSIDKRLAKCLPEGTTIKIEIFKDDSSHFLQRTSGGLRPETTSAKPIVFSQVELARRSMEPAPSVELLDIHCPQSDLHEQEIKRLFGEFSEKFAGIVELADQARGLRIRVENQLEGLEATRAAYFDLVGDENTAKSLGDLKHLENWHDEAALKIENWRRDFTSPPGPDLPVVPQMQTDIVIGDYVPSHAISKAVKDYQCAIRGAANKLTDDLIDATRRHHSKVDNLRQDVQTKLGEGQSATANLAEEAERLRTRLTELEQKAAELDGVDQRIGEGLEITDGLIDQAERSWTDLRDARKSACTVVNQSMPSFIVRLNPDGVTEEIDELLNDLKTGTGLHQTSMHDMRDELDRKSFVRSAIDHLQFPSADENSTETSGNAEKIAWEAMDKKKYDGIAKLAILWPRDGIEILLKPQGGAPVPFDNLTEGLKALAIKEISFAASHLPVVTDQPEDAVPTAAIFNNLVPTLREQRAFRQFIVASHDANVVVSGDMERVVVFPPEAGEQPIVGTLFDTKIRKHAIELLEGGDRAFNLRSKRYGDLG